MSDIFSKIKQLKWEQNIVILVLYYQDPDIPDVADFMGDSLALAFKPLERMLALS